MFNVCMHNDNNITAENINNMHFYGKIHRPWQIPQASMACQFAVFSRICLTDLASCPLRLLASSVCAMHVLVLMHVCLCMCMMIFLSRCGSPCSFLFLWCARCSFGSLCTQHRVCGEHFSSLLMHARRSFGDTSVPKRIH